MSESMSLGENLRVARKTRGLSTVQLAGMVSVSPSLIQKLESGSRRATPSLSIALARALRFGPEVLTGQPYYGDPEAEDEMHAVIPELRRIMLCFDAPDPLDVRPRSLATLGLEIDRVYALRRNARYAPMGPLLAPVISELTHVALDSSDSQQRQAFVHLAHAYRAVNSLAHKMGHHDLSGLALERVRWAADRSGDPLLQVLAGYLIASAMVRLGAVESARRKFAGLRDELERLQPEAAYGDAALAADGALLQKLAVVESRNNNISGALNLLDEAREVAHMAGDRDTSAFHDVSFGPTNIMIHTVHVLADTGDNEQALARLQEWGTDGVTWTPPAATAGERASHHHIDLASARLATGDRAGAFDELRRSRKIAANHTRFHPSVRETLRMLVRASAHPSPELTSFAAWAGVARAA